MRKNRVKAREIGARIAERRRFLGMTQRELAEPVGVSERSIQAYEQGETIPGMCYVEQLEKALGCTWYWLYYGRETPLRGNEENLLQIMATEVRSLRHFVEGELLDVRSELARLASNSFNPDSKTA